MRKTVLSVSMLTLTLGLVGLASGQFPFGRFGGGGEGRRDPVSLLNNPSVKKELELTDEQADKIPAAVMNALKGVLDSKQFSRLKQIELQTRGTAAFTDPEIQDTLKLSDDQRDNIKTIVEDSRREMREAFKGGDFKGGFEKMENLRKETTEKLQGVLNVEQKKAWRGMTGEPFKMERPMFDRKGFPPRKKAPDA